MRYDNKPFYRLFIYRYKKKYPDLFYYSTIRDDLVVDPAKDPNKLKPRQGSYLPPYPDTEDKHYQVRRAFWKTKFDEELLKALEEGGESLGDIYYKWFHIDSLKYNKRYPNPKQTKNTRAVRKLLEYEKVRHPLEFF